MYFGNNKVAEEPCTATEGRGRLPPSCQAGCAASNGRFC